MTQLFSRNQRGMRFFSVNKLVDELKAVYVKLDKVELLLNIKLFNEDKFKNMVGPILLMSVYYDGDKVDKLSYTRIVEKFGEDIRIKMNFPQDNKCQYLICSVNGNETNSQFGPFHQRSYSKVGFITQRLAQKLTQDFEKNKERIGDAIEMVDNGEDL